MAQAKEFATLLETVFNIKTPLNKSTSITKESSGSSGGTSALMKRDRQNLFQQQLQEAQTLEQKK